jgi:hypothetical protein
MTFAEDGRTSRGGSIVCGGKVLKKIGAGADDSGDGHGVLERTCTGLPSHGLEVVGLLSKLILVFATYTTVAASNI